MGVTISKQKYDLWYPELHRFNMAGLFDYFSVPSLVMAIAIHMLVGALWYSPMAFGDAFLKLAHPKLRGKPEMDYNALVAAAIGSAISMPVLCFVFSYVRPNSGGEGALWGAAIALLFDAALNSSHNLWEKRPFALFVLHAGYHTFSLLVIGALLGLLCS